MSTEEDVSRKCVLPLDRCKCTAETDHGGQDDASTVAVAPVSGGYFSDATSLCVYYRQWV